MFKIGFDNEKYLQMQSDKIRERIGQFGGKLYLEFGGKLFDFSKVKLKGKLIVLLIAVAFQIGTVLAVGIDRDSSDTKSNYNLYYDRLNTAAAKLKRSSNRENNFVKMFYEATNKLVDEKINF